MLRDFKSKKLDPDRETEMFELLDEVDDIKALVTAPPFDFAARDYNRLIKRRRKAGFKRKELTPQKIIESQIERDERAAAKKFASEFYDEAQAIGFMVMDTLRNKAAEFGYVDESGKVEVRKFVDDSVKFYIEAGPKVEQLSKDLIGYQKGWMPVLADLCYRAGLTRLALAYLLQQHPELELDLIPLIKMLPKLPSYIPDSERIDNY